MANQVKAKLVLEDGSEYAGSLFGDTKQLGRVCEIVFETSMVGYQEIFSEPSYSDQFVLMTYPLIGNYGMTDEDYESRTPTIGGMIVREYNDQPSNFRYTKTLSEVMIEHHVPGLEGIDTRKLTRHIRDCGTCRAILVSEETTTAEALAAIAATPVPHDAVERVSCKKRWYARTANARYNVVAIDCGIRNSVVRELGAHGCNITVVPYNTPAEEIARMKPDGILISDGPGDPQDATPVIEAVRALRGQYPIFGIEFGHQILALACGATTYKMKFGHRGSNHAVRELSTGKVSVVSQNHSYAVDADSLAGTGLQVTHVDAFDNTVEGVADAEGCAFSIQYAPSGTDLYDRFIAMMEQKVGR